MKIENTLKIVGALDHCVIERRDAGKISIGGILIKEEEAQEFARQLLEAIKCLPRTDLDGAPLGKSRPQAAQPISPAPESR